VANCTPRSREDTVEDEAQKSSLVEIIDKVRRGTRNLHRLAQALEREPRMVFVPAQFKLHSFLTELEGSYQRFWERTRDRVAAPPSATSMHPIYPKPLGLRTKDGGFVPCAFTSEELAEAYAESADHVVGEEGFPLMLRPWSDAFRDYIARGFEGVAFDFGSPHALRIDRRAMKRLYALLTVGELAAREALYVVMVGKRVHQQRTKNGHIQVFMFDSPGAAAEGNRRLSKQADQLKARKVETGRLLRQFMRVRIDQLIVNPMIAGERYFSRQDLERMEALSRGEKIDEQTQPTAPKVEPRPSERLEFEASGVDIAVPDEVDTDDTDADGTMVGLTKLKELTDKKKKAEAEKVAEPEGPSKRSVPPPESPWG